MPGRVPVAAVPQTAVTCAVPCACSEAFRGLSSSRSQRHAHFRPVRPVRRAVRRARPERAASDRTAGDAQPARPPKVGKLHVAFLGDEQVGALDVAVAHAVRVEPLEAVEHLPHVHRHQRLGEAAERDLEVEIVEGVLVCPETDKRFPIKEGIPSML